MFKFSRSGPRWEMKWKIEILEIISIPHFFFVHQFFATFLDFFIHCTCFLVFSARLIFSSFFSLSQFFDHWIFHFRCLSIQLINIHLWFFFSLALYETSFANVSKSFVWSPSLPAIYSAFHILCFPLFHYKSIIDAKNTIKVHTLGQPIGSLSKTSTLQDLHLFNIKLCFVFVIFLI